MIPGVEPCKLARDAEVASGAWTEDRGRERSPPVPARSEACRLQRGEWARAHGIDGRSLNVWGVNLARRATPAAPRRRKPKAPRPTHALVELVPAGSSAKLAVGGRYVLEVAGARVEFGDDGSVATLRRVLEALRP